MGAYQEQRRSPGRLVFIIALGLSLLLTLGGCDASDGDSCNPNATLELEGTVGTSVAPLAFDQAGVATQHKLDVDASEDGCITTVTVALGVAVGDLTGCVMQFTAAGRSGASSSPLDIQAVTFTADSLCPGFSDSVEGVYTGGTSSVNGVISTSTSSIEGTVDQVERCWDGSVIVTVSGSLYREDGEELQISSSTVTITGDFLSEGRTDVSCP